MNSLNKPILLLSLHVLFISHTARSGFNTLHFPSGVARGGDLNCSNDNGKQILKHQSYSREDRTDGKKMSLVAC